MKTLPQYLKRKSNNQDDTKKEKEKEKSEIAQVHYLDEFVDVTTDNLVRGHAREDPQLLSNESLLYPRRRKAGIIKNTR